MKRRAAHYTHALLVAVALFAAAGTAATFLAARDPVKSLRIGVADLRARAAELAIVAASRADGLADETFASAMARQLGRQIDDALHAVEDDLVASPHEGERAAALGRELSSTASALASGPDPARAREAAASLERVGNTLAGLVRALGGS